MPARPTSAPILRLDKTLLSRKDLARVRDNLSAVVLQTKHLWLGGDEGTFVDRMTRDARGNFADHKRFDLFPLLALPGDAQEEIDIEGLDVDGGYLWLTGSHSSKRKKPEDDKSAAKNIGRLADVAVDANRFTLARVPISDGTLVQEVGRLTAARLDGDAKGNLLTEALRDDPHIGAFLSPRGIPSKDNGLDIEGLVVRGDRIFLGLRGPVLRGWAIILELQVANERNGRLTLKVFESGTKYRKHFLQLDGLGVRELALQGNALYILAGPTMDLDGPVFIYRWNNALDHDADSLTWAQDIERVIAVPFGTGNNHAEGIAIVDHDPLSLLVCYDSPSQERLENDDGVRADIFAVT